MARHSSQKQVSQKSGTRIQNAQIRFNAGRDSALTEEKIRQRTTSKQGRVSANDPQFHNQRSETSDRFKQESEKRTLQSRLLAHDARNTQKGNGQQRHRKSKHGKNSAEMLQVQNTIRDIFKNENQDITPTEVDELIQIKSTPLPRPGFPFFILILGTIKDVIDFLDFTGVGLILTTATTFLIAIILFFWYWGKMSFAGLKSGIIKKIWMKGFASKIWLRYAIAMGIESIPFLKFVPATTILILLSHHSENTVVKLINRILDEMVKGGIK